MDSRPVLDYDALNAGIAIAARLMLAEGLRVDEALKRGWREVGIEYADVPNGIKKYPSMLLPGAVERARREGTPLRPGRLMPVDPAPE